MRSDQRDTCGGFVKARQSNKTLKASSRVAMSIYMCVCVFSIEFNAGLMQGPLPQAWLVACCMSFFADIGFAFTCVCVCMYELCSCARRFMILFLGFNILVVCRV